MKLRALITDDELPGRENLAAMLHIYAQNVEVIGFADSVAECRIKIEELKPDVVFLDIELGDGTGFDVLENLEDKDFFVIFVTAYSSYAAQAFRTDATDYLLKPIDVEDLIKALDKVSERMEFKKFKTGQKVENSGTSDAKQESIKVVTNDGNEYISAEKIVYLKSINYLTLIVLDNGRELVAGHHLKEYEGQLSSDKFYRVHNSYMINIQYAETLKGGESPAVIMRGGYNIPVSRRRKEAIVRYFGAKK